MCEDVPAKTAKWLIITSIICVRDGGKCSEQEIMSLSHLAWQSKESDGLQQGDGGLWGHMRRQHQLRKVKQWLMLYHEAVDMKGIQVAV